MAAEALKKSNNDFGVLEDLTAKKTEDLQKFRMEVCTYFTICAYFTICTYFTTFMYVGTVMYVLNLLLTQRTQLYA